jgi:hypothetical protein
MPDKTYHARLEMDFDSDNEANAEQEILLCTTSDKQNGVDRLNNMNPRPSNYGLKVDEVLKVEKAGTGSHRPRLTISVRITPKNPMKPVTTDYQKERQDAAFEKSAKSYSSDFCKIRSIQSYSGKQQ